MHWLSFLESIRGVVVAKAYKSNGRASGNHRFQKDLNSIHKPWLARKHFLTNQKQGNPNASGSVSVRVSFPEVLPFFIWSMLAVILFVNISCRLAALRSPRMAIIKAILCLQTSASLSLCTPAKSKASFKKPCLSVRNIDPITASASCHTRFQFLWWRVSEWPGAAWDWVPGMFCGGCKVNWKMTLNEPVSWRVPV